MENFYQVLNGNGLSKADNHLATHPRLSWLDIRVFYVRFSKFGRIPDDLSTTPESLTLNHIPLDPNTLAEINGVRRASVYSSSSSSTYDNNDDGGMSTLLRRDRFDKKSKEVTFVTTDSIRLTGSVRFEVFADDGVIVLSGVLGLSNTRSDGHGCVGDNEQSSFRGKNDNNNDSGSMIWNLDTDLVSATGSCFLMAKDLRIEVYVAGSFLGNPIILTKNIHVGCSRKKRVRSNGMLNTIAEAEFDETEEDRNDLQAPSRHGLQVAEYQDYKPAFERYSSHFYHGTTEFLGEDEELSWFNAGVRVGVGIGLSVCLGVGIGVGLLVKTYQGATRGLRRRPL